MEIKTTLRVNLITLKYRCQGSSYNFNYNAQNNVFAKIDGLEFLIHNALGFTLH